MTDRNKLFTGLFILLVTIAIGVWQWNTMLAYKIETEALNKEAANLQIVKNSLIEDYQNIKVDVAEIRETAAQEVDLVFPTQEDITNLTRLFDQFAVKNNFQTNPFFISKIQYSNTVDLGSYRYVPVSMDITTSKKNLNKFFEFVETSGSLEAETRLMSIENINIGYPSEYGGTYDVRLDINAYFSQEI